VPYWKRFALASAIGALAVFALIAGNIAAGDPLLALDVNISTWFARHRVPALTLLMLAVTHAHAPVALCAYTAVLAFVFHRRGSRRWLLAVALAVPVGLALNVALKHIFHRSRPVIDDPLMTLSSFSFPSGHTAGATLFYGILAAYAVSRTRNVHLRGACIAAWLGLAALVAFSRVYLGVHYLSDVVAAAAWSLAWLAVSLLVASRARVDTRRSPS
jgi:membrane-associated phospholipid phosphatase